MITITRNLPYISPSGNPMVIKVLTDNHMSGGVRRPFYTIFLEIYVSGVLIRTESVEPDGGGNAEFDISEIIRGQLTPAVVKSFSGTVYTQHSSDAYVTFYCNIKEGYGAPLSKSGTLAFTGSKYAVVGGFSDSLLEQIESTGGNQYIFLDANRIFLTNQPTFKRTNANQPEFLRFLRTDEPADTYKVMLEQYGIGGNVLSLTTLETFDPSTNLVFTIDVTTGSKVTINPLAAEWAVWISNVTTNEDVTERLYYKWDERNDAHKRYVVFRNSLGGYDSVCFVGAMSTNLESEPVIGNSLIVTNLRRAIVPTKERSLTQEVLVGAIGYNSNEELKWLRDLFNSEEVWLVGDNWERLRLRNTESLGSTDTAPGTFDVEADKGVPDFFLTS